LYAAGLRPDISDVYEYVSGLGPGLAKLGHHPGEAFMELLVDACVARRLRDFNPQNLANTINGEARMRFLRASLV
jgi:hypothetical protein